LFHLSEQIARHFLRHIFFFDPVAKFSQRLVGIAICWLGV
jgi:hypothetical protein